MEIYKKELLITKIILKVKTIIHIKQIYQLMINQVIGKINNLLNLSN